METPDSSGVHNFSMPPWFVEGDYLKAVVTCAMCRENDEHHLAFAKVELLPAEFPEPDLIGPANKVIGTRTWTITRDLLDASDAFRWYAHAVSGSVAIPPLANLPSSHLTVSLLSEPAWPHVVATGDLPFLQRWHATPRIHHLLHANGMVRAQQLTKADLTYLAERLFVDFASYGEFYGSMHLVAPNPLFRTVGHRLIRNPDGSEFVRFHFVPRHGLDASNVDLWHAQRRPTGWTAVENLKVATSITDSISIGSVAESAHALVCPQRGVLEVSSPAPFLSQISFSMRLTGGVRSVNVPATRRRAATQYTAADSVHDSMSVVGDPAPDSAWRLLAAGQQRRHSLPTTDQFIFDGREDAAGIVRRLLSQASKDVLIHDPYFGVWDLIAYVAAVPRNIPIQVLLKQSNLNRETEIESTKATNGALLQSTLRQEPFSNVSVKMLSESQKPIHDRFLVVDGRVWLSGHSLNSLDTAVSVLTRIPRPEPVISILTESWEQARPLSDWRSIEENAPAHPEPLKQRNGVTRWGRFVRVTWHRMLVQVRTYWKSRRS